MTDTSPPHRIRTQRCVLRVADPAEAVLLRAAIDSSLEHLRAWLPWAVQEPRSLAETKEHLVRGRERFEQCDDFQYSIFDGDEREILGGVGLHRRGEPGCLEIGYWIRRDRVGQGLATECVRALTIAALGMLGIDRVQIDCDPENQASRRIPEKLGYDLLQHRLRNKKKPTGELRDTLVYQISDPQRLT